MKIYEMIFHKGAYEKTQLFYKIYNKSSRKHFIEQIKLEIDTELNDFKNNCDSHHKKDLLSLFNIVHKESHLHINTMAKDFIRNSNAEIDQHVFLEIKEHDVLSI